MNFSAVVFNDSIYHAQPEARTFAGFFGGEKRFENMGSYMIGYSGSGIGYGYEQTFLSSQRSVFTVSFPCPSIASAAFRIMFISR
jgi:hypothetical protein